MTFNGHELYNSILSGATEIISNKQYLNKINVFPVADGDTGSNLSTTMNHIIENMKNTNDFSLVIESAAESALSGARGNSGIIFAQFFYGFYVESRDLKEIGLNDFISIMKKNVERLYNVVTSPVEGTILTVIKEWVNSIEKHKNNFKTLEVFLASTLKDTELAVKNTTNQLSVLLDKGVVDSGAKGFFLFIKGVSDYLRTGKIPEIKKTLEKKLHLNKEFSHVYQEDNKYRFCCEALIKGNEINIEQIKKELSEFGDSLIVAGGLDLVKIHMHTSRPEEMYAKMRKFGKLSGIKADDMNMQVDIINNKKSKTAIVTDSVADLPEGFEIENQVFVIPMQIEIDEALHLDRISISSKTFYDINKTLKEQPKTSLPNIKNVENLFNFLLEHYENILVLSVSKKLSGTYDMLESTAKKINGKNIIVIDTLTNSGAQGLLVKKATEMAQTGISISKIKDEIHTLIKKNNIYVAVDNPKYLERSGRVSRTVGKIAKILNLKPIMTIDKEGNGKAYGGAFSQKTVLKKIEKIITNDHKSLQIQSFSIMHANSYEKAKILAKNIELIVGKKVEYISTISPVVGSIAGEGAIAVAYTTIM